MRRLAIRPGGIGDVIVSLPALERLRTGYLEVWTSSRTVPLIRFADRVRGIDSTGLESVGVTEPPARLMEELREFDSIVTWYGANRLEFREAMAGLPFHFLSALPPEDCPVHAVDFYLGQVGELFPPVELGAVPRIECAVKRAEYAVIQPFSGSARKNWDLAKFQAFAKRLFMPVHWCAGPEDPPLEGAVRFDNLYELARFLAGARLYIGNDSGITHLAAAVGTPTLAIFGPTNPAVWGPRGDHVRIVQAKMKDKG